MVNKPLHKKMFLVLKNVKTKKCKYCGKSIREYNKSMCCSNCLNKQRDGSFLVKRFREKNGITN